MKVFLASFMVSIILMMPTTIKNAPDCSIEGSSGMLTSKHIECKANKG